MFLWIGIGLVAGCMLGLVLGRAWAGSSTTAELQDKNRLLEAAREREVAQREQTARLEEATRQLNRQIAELKASLDRTAAEAE
ncbi:MAG: hypothetical protein WBD46_19890, partial [Acidobacteriaceae bacterium]